MPDLARIPRERWHDVLAPLTPSARDWAVKSQRSTELVVEAMQVAWEIKDLERERRLQLRKAAARETPLPAPGARGAPRRSRQVNIRLYERDYRRLGRAAALLGATPTELARNFVVRGTARVLDEDDRLRAQPDKDGRAQP